MTESADAPLTLYGCPNTRSLRAAWALEEPRSLRRRERGSGGTVVAPERRKARAAGRRLPPPIGLRPDGVEHRLERRAERWNP